MCANAILKSILITINLIFCIFGSLLVVSGLMIRRGTTLGVIVKLLEKVFDDAQRETIIHRWVPVLIGIGAICLCLAFIGLIGACCEIKILLYFYAGALVGLTISELVGIIMVLTNNKAIEELVDKALKIAIERIKTSPREIYLAMMRQVHNFYNCCGRDKGLSDFSKNVQDGLCKSNYTTITCVRPIAKAIKKNFNKLTALCAGLMIVQVMSIAASIAVGCDS
ncbi:hypothetical protein ACOME3_001012 [Neoechinorhynchus agilis]